MFWRGQTKLEVICHGKITLRDVPKTRFELKSMRFGTFLGVTQSLGGVMSSDLFLRHTSTSVDVLKGSDDARSDMSQ